MRRHTVKNFPKGTRVYYNYWGYKNNTPGTVVGMPRHLPYGTYRHDRAHNWECIRIKFDHLKNPRNVPIYSHKGCHLSEEPLDDAEAFELSHPR